MSGITVVDTRGLAPVDAGHGCGEGDQGCSPTAPGWDIPLPHVTSPVCCGSGLGPGSRSYRGRA